MQLFHFHIRSFLAVFRVLVAIGAVGAAGWGAVPSAQADYSFQIPRMEMEVFVHPDASLQIRYQITFQNNPSGQTIDIVDIGTPTEGYDLNSVRAHCRGRPARLIRPSEYVHPGFEVHLGQGQIPPGQQGQFHTEFLVRNLVFQDTTRSDYASLRVTPTWFGQQFLTGTTHLKLAVHLPPGIQPEEVLHQGQPFSDKAFFQNHVVVVWEWPNTRLTQPHLVGVSFPKRVMEHLIRQTAWDLFLHWFRHSPGARWTLGLVVLVLFGVVYFRFTGGTGGSLFVLLSIGLVILFIRSPGWQLASLPIVMVLLVGNEWLLRHRVRGYLPPIAYIEGGGIKRGLTAPEAACLLELPLGRVLGLVIFGLLKKGVLRQVSEDPLVVEVVEEFRYQTRSDRPTSQTPAAPAETPAAFYRRVAQEKGVILHSYEHPFLTILEAHPGEPVEKIDFGPALQGLIERVVDRMKGFDLQQTKEYYRWVVRRAVEQAAAIGEIPQRQEHLDRQFEWVLMDEDWPTVFVGPYRPPWMRGSTWGPAGRPVRPLAPPSMAGPASPAPAAPTSIPGQPTLQDVSASFAGWAENTFGRLASSLMPGSVNPPTASGGFLDLSGLDRVTSDFFQALAEARSSGGGGGGGGCACACAGCACACACAGGGR